LERIALRDGHTCRTGEFEDAAVFGEAGQEGFAYGRIFDRIRNDENLLRSPVQDLLVGGRRISGPTKIGDGTLLLVGGHALLLRVLTQDMLDAIREEFVRPLGPVSTLSGAMAIEIRRLRRLAGSGQEILLAGETGVGKEVYAQAVHRASGRPGRLVAVNCAALPTELVESELFGFVRGAHSQAAASKPGLIEEAEHGTLFLDEIGDMPKPAQAKLLRFLQEHEYMPLGGREVRRMDVRVIAATASLALRPDDCGLRRDLLARFGAGPVVFPPLRERREDVGMLTAHFLGQAHTLEEAAFFALCLYDWPQNVRELENVVREAVLHSEGRREIRLEDFPCTVRERVTIEQSDQAICRRPRRARPEKAEIEALLGRHKGNVAEVARELDRQWAVVWRWVVKSGIDIEEFRR
jgi:transcriptional regulator with PAS, ATPase and Fis domain